MTRWEYLKLGTDGPNCIEELNRLGPQGWELVSTSAPEPLSRYWVFFFKRPMGLVTVAPEGRTVE